MRWNYDPTSACFNQRCHYELIITKDDGSRQTTERLWVAEYTLTNANPEIQYCFKVNCCNDCGESTYSETSCSSICEDCGQVLNLRESSATEDLIQVNWSGSTTDYVLYYWKETSNNSSPDKIEVPLSQNYFRLTNPGCNTCYFFEVQCKNLCTEGVKTAPL